MIPRTIAFLVFFTAISLASAQTIPQPDIGQTARALETIRTFSDKFCTEIPSAGNRRQYDLSVDAKAELSGFLRKLVEIGVGIDNNFKSESYQGLLQKDLAIALRDRSNCKEKLWVDLRDRLLPPPTTNTNKATRPNDIGGQYNTNGKAIQNSPPHLQTTNDKCMQDAKDMTQREMEARIAMRDCRNALEKPLPPSVYTFLHTEDFPRETCRDLYIDALEKEFPGKRTENYPAAVSVAAGAYRIYVACRRNIVVISVSGPEYDISVRHATKLYERVASRGACPELCKTAVDPYRADGEQHSTAGSTQTKILRDFPDQPDR